VDPTEDPVGFLNALPAIEASCLSDALGGRERVLAILESGLGFDPITSTEARAIDRCVSDDTVQGIFVGQLEREAGGLSDATVACIGEQVGGLSAAALFVEEPAVDAAISLLKGIFCLNNEERTAISSSGAAYGFGELGGIDALECVVNGAGPTGLADLLGSLSADSSGAIDFLAVAELFPVFVECGAVDDSAFEEIGLTADQVSCLLTAVGDVGLSLLDSTAAEPELGDLAAMFTALDDCGISLEDLMDASLPLDPDGSGAIIVDPTVQVVATIVIPDITDLDLPLSDEEIICLTEELDEDAILALLAGGVPDLSLFAAIETCNIDLLKLLAP
jgi:hypothetical protein